MHPTIYPLDFFFQYYCCRLLCELFCVQSVTTWSSDLHFGAQRLIGCNPLMIRLCELIPEKYDHSCFKHSKNMYSSLLFYAL